MCFGELVTKLIGFTNIALHIFKKASFDLFTVFVLCLRALLNADVILLLGARLNWILHFGKPPRFKKDVKIIQVETCSNFLLFSKIGAKLASVNGPKVEGRKQENLGKNLELRMKRGGGGS